MSANFVHTPNRLAEGGGLCLNSMVKPLRMRVILALGLALPAGFSAFAFDDKPVVSEDGSVAIDLPPGWRDSKQNMSGSSAVAGYESSDRRTSMYILKADDSGTMDVAENLEGMVRDMFEGQAEVFIVRKIDPTKRVTVGDLPGAYIRLEVDLKTDDRVVPFVYHLTAVGAKSSIYILQGSLHKPVREVREQEIFRMIRSFRVRR